MGTSTISATLDGVSGSTVLTVTAPVLSSIAVTPANPSLAKGLTQQFTATGTYSDNSTQDLTGQVTWSSARPSTATISSSGLATGLSTGAATIAANLNGVTSSTVLTVTAPSLPSITLTPSNPSLAKGLTEQFTATGTYTDALDAEPDEPGNLDLDHASGRHHHHHRSGHGCGDRSGDDLGDSERCDRLDGIDSDGARLVVDRCDSREPKPCEGPDRAVHGDGHLFRPFHAGFDEPGDVGLPQPNVATITTAGLATAVATGPATISATLDDVSGSTVLTVTPAALVSIAVGPADPSLAKGLTEQFTAIGTYTDNSTQDLTNQVTWASGTPAAATITTAGLATGVATGPSTISASLNGVSGSTVLTVTAATLVSIAVTPSNSSLAKGLAEPFTATGTYTDNSTQNLTSQVTWASTRPTVATISSTGVATGVATGASTISATLNGVNGETVLTVTAASLVSIAVNSTTSSVAKGLTDQFTAVGTYSDNSTKDLTSQVNWSSDMPSVATISTDGLATSIAPGMSTVSATRDGVSGTTVLTVTPASLLSITVNPSSPVLVAGQAAQLTAMGTYSDNSTQDLTNEVSWSSATPSIATITTAGLSTGVAPGNSTIFAVLNGVTGTRVLTVTVVSLVSIAVTSSNPSLAQGLTQQFVATGTYSDNSTQNVTGQVSWVSASPSVASITATGLSTGVAVGKSTISATLNGVSGSTVLTVSAAASAATSPVTIMSLRVEKVSLGSGQHLKKALVLVVQFSGALGTTAAQNLAAYTALSGKFKKVHKAFQVVYNKLLPLTQAIYDSSADSVTLIPRGKSSLPKLERLQVNVSLLTDPLGRPINNGNNFNATVSNKGLVISSSLSAEGSQSPAPAAVDALFARGLDSSLQRVRKPLE